MLRTRIPLQMTKQVVKRSQANMNTQQIVDKTKAVIHDAETTKSVAEAAKEKLSSAFGKGNQSEYPCPTYKFASTKEMNEKLAPEMNTPHQGVNKTKTVVQNAEEREGNQYAGGSGGPQVGVDDKKNPLRRDI